MTLLRVRKPRRRRRHQRRPDCTLSRAQTPSFKANPSNKATPKKGVHTLASVSVGHDSTVSSRGGTSRSVDDEDDGDYVEDGATPESDDDDDHSLGAELLNDALIVDQSNDIHDARENQVDAEGSRLGTRSQSEAAIRHEEATRAKLMFLERLSRGKDKTADKGVEVGGNGTAAVDRDAEV